MSLDYFNCAQCSKEFQRERGQANRTLKKSGGIIFCSMDCKGLHYRSGKSIEQKKQEKAEYDKQYREKNSDQLKAKKAAYFKKTYDPEKAKEHRKLIMPRHVEYCRQPKYKEYKRQYDQQYRAKKQYGDFWEAALALNQLEQEVNERADYTERAAQKCTTNKCQTRKRDYEQSIKC